MKKLKKYLSKITKNKRNRWIILGSIIVVVVILGYFLIPKPASILYTSTNSIVTSVWFDTEISYDIAPTELKENVMVDGISVDKMPVFPSDTEEIGEINYINFYFTIMAKKPYASDEYYHLDWLRFFLSPVKQSFETGYLTEQYEWGAPQVDTSTTIYYKVLASMPNHAGKWEFIWQGSTVEEGSYYAGADSWEFELTGSNVLNPLTNTQWVEIDESSSKVVDFKGGIPIGAEEATIPLQDGDGEETDGILPDIEEITPSFEWPTLLIALIIGGKYVKNVKRKSKED